VVFIGTGADEKCIGLAEIKAEFERAFSHSEEVYIKLDWYSVSAAGPVAWVTADASIYAKVGGQETHFPIRLTTVLEQRNGRWLVVQSHDSLPAASQKDGESFPMEH
jgi:ketosteroid isomerase-like protein